MGTKGRQDHYQVLGVSPGADDEVIRAAYRAMAGKYHPDRNPGDPTAELKLKRLNAAFQVLGDPAKRKQYDELTQSPVESEAPEEPHVERTDSGARGPEPEVQRPRPRTRPEPRQAPKGRPRSEKIKTCWHCGALVQPNAHRCTRCWEEQFADEPERDGNERNSNRPKGEKGRSPTVRSLYAVGVMGLSLWMNTSDVPISQQRDAAVLGMFIGLIILGALVFWATGKNLGGPIVIFVCVIAIGIHAGTASERTHNDPSDELHRTPEPAYPSSAPTATAAPRALRKLTPLEWQRCLLSSGYDIGPTGADGIWGPQSQFALDLWNARHPDGLVTTDEIRRCWGE